MKRLILLFLIALAAVVPVLAQDAVSQGKALLLQGKITEAISVLQSRVDSHPRDSQAMKWLGNAYLQAENPGMSETIGKNLISLDEKSPEGYVLTARAQAAMKKFGEAYTTLKKGAKPTKNNYELLIELGNVYLAHDSTSQAVVAYTQAKEKKPNDPAILRGMGNAYIKMGTEAMGMMQFEQSLNLDSNQVDLRYQMAKIYLTNKQYVEAGRMYQSILRMQPDNDRAAMELAGLYELAKQYREAAKVLEQYVQRHPEDDAAWIHYTEDLANSKQWDSAQSAAEKVLQKDPTNKIALLAAARASFYGRNYEASIDFYNRLAINDTLTADDMLKQGFNYLKQKNDSLLAHWWEKSLEKDSTQSVLYNDLAGAFMRMQSWEKAAKWYGKKMESDTTYTTAYINYSLCQQQLKNFEQSRIALQKALAMSPSFVYGYYYLGTTYVQMDSIKQAERTYETFLAIADTLETEKKDRLKNEITRVYRFLGIAYLQDKNLDKAIPTMEKYLDFVPDDIDFHMYLAGSYAAKNRKDDARREYQRVLKIKPGYKEAQDQIDRLDLYN